MALTPKPPLLIRDGTVQTSTPAGGADNNIIMSHECRSDEMWSWPAATIEWRPLHGSGSLKEYVDTAPWKQDNDYF